MTIDLSTVASVIDIVAVLGAAAAAAWYAFSGQRGSQRAADDVVASNLIQNLKTTTDIQEKTISDLSIKLDNTTKDLHLMQGRNTVLETLFNGSEGSIMAFLKMAPDLQRIADENNKLAKETNANVQALTASVDKLVNALTLKLV